MSQEEGIDYDETFAPVARMEAIRIFLDFATYMNFKLQMTSKVLPEWGTIGSLMYLTETRHDIQFSTVLCARYQSNPKESHLTSVKRILRYLKEKAPQVPVSNTWSRMVLLECKKQLFSGSPSAEAEYVVAVGCYASILWIKSQLSDYDIHYKMVPIFCDNTSAIAISNNPVLHSRTNILI
ncbi:hypothetical protein Tco_0108798 [Tanacetum coccineum]